MSPMEQEKYTGVRALFNGDLHATIPEWAPREDWIVLSRDVIRFIGESSLKAVSEEMRITTDDEKTD